MDLDRIQTKLDTRAYETAEAGFDFDRFQEDLLLVFNNAIDFNSSEVAVVRVTKTAPPAATAAAARPPTAANDEVRTLTLSFGGRSSMSCSAMCT